MLTLGGEPDVNCLTHTKPDGFWSAATAALQICVRTVVICILSKPALFHSWSDTTRWKMLVTAAKQPDQWSLTEKKYVKYHQIQCPAVSIVAFRCWPLSPTKYQMLAFNLREYFMHPNFGLYSSQFWEILLFIQPQKQQKEFNDAKILPHLALQSHSFCLPGKNKWDFLFWADYTVSDVFSHHCKILARLSVNRGWGSTKTVTRYHPWWKTKTTEQSLALVLKTNTHFSQNVCIFYFWIKIFE